MPYSHPVTILLLTVMILSGARECCVPILVQAQSSSHCSHSSDESKPECSAPDEAVIETARWARSFGLLWDWTGVPSVVTKALDGLPHIDAALLAHLKGSVPLRSRPSLEKFPLLI